MRFLRLAQPRCPQGKEGHLTATTLLTPFHDRVRETPGATALVFENTELTYAELDTRVNRLARHLLVEGVGPDVLVALVP